MNLLQILLLALVQGVTEFLPVSSSAHLILANRLLGWSDEGLVLDLAVHLGSLLAVMVYFRQDLLAMLRGRPTTDFPHVPSRRLMLWLVLATVPLGLVGLAGAAWIETHLRTVLVIALATVGFGLVLGLADRRRGREQQLGPAQVIAMALAQVLSLIPGASRSGVTITAGLLMGLSRQQAARFSFLMAIPAVGAAGLYGVLRMLEAKPPMAWDAFFLAIGAAFVGAWACIDVFLRLVDRIGMMPFVVYRLLLGGALLIWAV